MASGFYNQRQLSPPRDAGRYATKVLTETMAVDEIIGDATNDSDIAFGSDLYEEISRELTRIGLNLAFFVFTNSEHSSCARTLNGTTASYPVLTLYLKYAADFQATGIDPHQGNWNDKWARTRPIRNILNAMLQRHGLDRDHVSDHTFIFVRTLEELAFRQLGEQCTDGVRRLVTTEAPGVHVERVYWNGSDYYVLMRDKSDYKLVNRNVKTDVTKAIRKLLADADQDGCCQDYNTTIEFGYDGNVPMQFLRG